MNLNITENYTKYDISYITGIAMRENNNKRKNLIVNYLQSKHVPSIPSETLNLFYSLADRINTKTIPEDYILVIGFAETATAIGAAVAERIGRKTRYIHTSREEALNKYRIIDFQEEHSHATEQNLFCKNKEKLFSNVKMIIFVEDELTTGKTILNFIDKLKSEVSKDCVFCAASIINGMNKDAINQFKINNIDVTYLVKCDNSVEMMNTKLNIISKPDEPKIGWCKNITYINIDKYVNPRLGCKTDDYIKSCEYLISQALPKVRNIIGANEKYDIIGTQECMYPAIRFAYKMENLNYDLRCHSTTRSPIIPSIAPGYPLTSRIKIHSFYDIKRDVYLYNIHPCDAVILITDTTNLSEKSVTEFAEYLKTEKLIIINWGK